MKTFVFTDIVRSVDLKSQMLGANDEERDVAFVSTILTPHRERIERGLEKFHGRVVSTAGDGHFLVFANTISAASWAIRVQQDHRDDPVITPRGNHVEVRMSLHVGFPQPDPNDPNNFIGRVVDYAARLNDFAAAKQILISTAALGLLKDAGLTDVAFHDHGPRELRGIGAVEVHELLYDGAKPKPTRKQPAYSQNREWTVLPATMGLTEYGKGGKHHKEGGSGAVASPEAPPVRTVGNYELRELLGAGGMGAVYKARHKQFGRDRAVKIIKPHLLPHGQGDTRHEEIVRRFYREIKAVGALDHPNIVVAIDSSTPEDDTHYLVMEYVDGFGAEELVARGEQMEVAAACEIARQAALGLEYIHRQGMVHRDIKPSNLMLTVVDRSGHDVGTAGGGKDSGLAGSVLGAKTPLVKILDLGLALLVSEDQPRLTQMGHGAMGTAMYMSPEQWNTTSVDIRSDIYSLGCTLYHLLTGRPPFFDSDLRPQKAHEKLPVPTQYGRSDIPRELSRVLKKMMAKRPEDRYSHPAEVAEALSGLASENNLARAIDRRRQENLTTQRSSKEGGDTLASGGSASDTLGPAPPTPFYSPWQSTPPQPLWRRVVAPLAILAALAAVVWMAMVASSQQRSLDAVRRQNLIVPAGLAASLLANEIDARFDVLERLSRDPELLAAMQEADTSNPETWKAAQAWIVEAKEDSDRRVPADSWFLVAPDGIQIARAKPSDSIGNSYQTRDYFHGQGHELEDGETAEPIKEKNLSTVYRSTSTRKLKVAFSVPIRSRMNRPGESNVIGVLGMSVDLGQFRVLEDAQRLPEELEVVLVDLRKYSLPEGAPPRDGLLLHHPQLAQYEVPSDPFRLPEKLLTQVQQTMTRSNRSGSPLDPIIQGYGDLLERSGGSKYVGAFEPVVIRNQDEIIDTRWLVIVQEKME